MSAPRNIYRHYVLTNMTLDDANDLINVLDGYAFNVTTNADGSQFKAFPAGEYRITDPQTNHSRVFSLSAAVDYSPEFDIRKNTLIAQQLLNTRHKGQMFLLGGCVISDNHATDKFYLFHNQDWVMTASTDSRDEPVLHLFEDLQSENPRGGSAEVLCQLGTMRYSLHDRQTLTYAASRLPRVLRLSEGDDDSEYLARETKKLYFSRQSPHLAVRGPTFFSSSFTVLKNNDETKAVNFGISMRYLKEHDLHDFLIADTDELFFSLDDRFELTLELMCKVKQQVHARKLKHRDLKMDNVRVQKIASVWSCNIVDFNDALPMHLNDGRDAGTYEYRPKEMFANNSSQASDISMLGLMVSGVWRHRETGLPDLSAKSFSERRATVNACREKDKWKIDWNLFIGIEDLSSELQDKIKKLLDDMVAELEVDRPDISTCIERFENIYLEYKVSKLAESVRPAFTAASLNARASRVLLDGYALKPIQALDSFEVLQKIVNDGMHAINDTPLCIQEFIKTTKLNVLWGAIRKNDINLILQKLITHFHENMSAIIDIKHQLNEAYQAASGGACPQFESIKRDALRREICHIELFIKKVLSAPRDLNAIPDLLDKMKNERMKLSASLEYFDELLSRNINRRGPSY